LKNAPAKDALMALAQLGGYGFVYVENPAPAERSFLTQGTGASSGVSSGSFSTTKEAQKAQPVIVSFAGESYGRALNAVLLGSGLQAKLEGRTIYALMSCQKRLGHSFLRFIA